MDMKHQVIRALLYVLFCIKPISILYVLVFTGRPECVTPADHINAYLADAEMVSIGKGFILEFVASLIAVVALLRVPISSKYFKLVVLYAFAIFVAISTYWQQVNLWFLVAFVLLVGEFMQHKRKNPYNQANQAGTH